MRRASLVFVMVALIAAVLTASLWSVERAHRQAIGELRGVQGKLAQETASALRSFLDSLDRDTRFLATLSARVAKDTPYANAEKAAIVPSFQALAIVVPHYRTVGLFHAGSRPLVAVDPSETSALVPDLVSASETLAAVAVKTKDTAHSGPVHIGGNRSFYLFAAPAGADEAVVASTDAAVMLETVARRPADGGGIVFLDPSGAVWIGCEAQGRCRFLPPGSFSARALAAVLEAPLSGDTVEAPLSVQQLGFPRRLIVGDEAAVSSPLGAWRLAVVSPAIHLDLRQRGFLWQLAVTTAGVATVILAVGFLILRQQAKAAALMAQLQAAEEVARLQKQLIRSEKLVTVGVLSAGLAHEIGTPLAVVRARAEHMLEREPESRDADDLNAIVTEIDRISSKIERVLDVSRDERPKLGRTEVLPALKRILEQLEWRLSSKGIKVTIPDRTDLPPLAARPDQFEQVMVNLIRNACDASAREAVVRVEVQPESGRPGYLRIDVADQGEGIRPHHLNAVFDPYFTTKRRGEGTGLGLAIVWQIVRSHRGEISLRSTVGVGTIATVLWPSISEDAKEQDQVA